MFVCSECENRVFTSKKAISDHLRFSQKWHVYCSVCLVVFANKESLESHRINMHPDRDFSCRQCKKSFNTRRALEEHYRGSSAHPNCQKCGQGFRNVRLRDEHHSQAHPCVPCAACPDRLFYEEDILDHYLESPNHPSCALCKKGFPSDEQFNKHALEMHSSTRCQLCQRQFDSNEALEQHLLVSVQHPKCSDCHKGFMDDDVYNAHLAAEHFVKEALERNSTFLDTKVPTTGATDYRQGSNTILRAKLEQSAQDRLPLAVSTEDLGTRGNMKSAPCLPKPTAADTQSPRSRLEHIFWDSSLAGRSGEQSSVWPSRVFPQADSKLFLTGLPFQQRLDESPEKSHSPYSGTSMSLSTKSSSSSLTGVSSIFTAATAQDAADAEREILKSGEELASPSLMVNDLLSEPRSDSPGQQGKSLIDSLSCGSDRHPSKQLPILTLQKWHTDSSIYLASNRGSTPSPDVGSPRGLSPLPDISPVPSTPTDIPSSLIITNRPPRPDGMASTLTVSRANSGQSLTSNPSYARLSSNFLPRISTKVERVMTPDFIKSSVSTSLNREIDRHGFREDAIFSMQLPSAVSPTLAFPNQSNSQHLRASTLPGESGRPAQSKGVPRLKTTSSLGGLSPSVGTEIPLTTPSTAVSSTPMHCRLCQRDPCDDPTATFCGHIFCSKCITDSVIASPRCPVCGNALLLYCLFRLDFSR